MSRVGYLANLNEAVRGVIATLRDRGIQESQLGFGREAPVPARKPTVPTDVRSEFLANRAMGDWAEQKMREALVAAFPGLQTCQYGDTSRLAAGDPGFKERYLAELDETRVYGKRPDLLLFSDGFTVDPSLSERSRSETESIATRALAAIEVRSSKFEAQKYMAVRMQERASGKRAGRDAPSFTVKVEDLIVVHRWIERHRVPQSYCQVFFDSIYAINLLDVFQIIALGTGFSIEAPEKSQAKTTVMIPITCGTKIGEATSMPEFTADHRVTRLGRHDVFVVPKGGGFRLDASVAMSVLLPELTS